MGRWGAGGLAPVTLVTKSGDSTPHLHRKQPDAALAHTIVAGPPWRIPVNDSHSIVLCDSVDSLLTKFLVSVL